MKVFDVNIIDHYFFEKMNFHTPDINSRVELMRKINCGLLRQVGLHLALLDKQKYQHCNEYEDGNESE